MEFMHFAGHHLESPVLTNVLLVVLCGIQLVILREMYARAKREDGEGGRNHAG